MVIRYCVKCRDFPDVGENTICDNSTFDDINVAFVRRQSLENAWGAKYKYFVDELHSSSSKKLNDMYHMINDDSEYYIETWDNDGDPYDGF